jgi:hypothetical protein
LSILTSALNINCTVTKSQNMSVKRNETNRSGDSRAPKDVHAQFYR